MQHKRDLIKELEQHLSLKEMIEYKLEEIIRHLAQVDGDSNLYHMVMREMEESLIRLVIREAKGNQTRAASILGINRNTLRKKIKELGIN